MSRRLYDQSCGNCQRWRLAASTATLLTVARGDTQRDFAAAAAEDGIVLERQSVPWLCERGHLVLPNVAAEARVLLERIYLALGADLDLLGTARSNRLPGDFVHPETGTLIEIDESQHFTTPRLTTLDLYPPDLPLGQERSLRSALQRRGRRAACRARYRSTRVASSRSRCSV